MTAMKYRKLRIAWSVAWGVVCLLLVVLWVRSYQKQDGFTKPVGVGKSTYIVSNRGTLYWFLGEVYQAPPIDFFYWNRMPDDQSTQTLIPAPLPPSPAWQYWNDDATEGIEMFSKKRWSLRYEAVAFTHWIALLLAAVVAFISWLPWRFSLRTLLIAMTLVAVVLGVIGYTLRT
jgi:hypothetical protein